jgi:hypothetical protein
MLYKFPDADLPNRKLKKRGREIAFEESGCIP